MEFLPNGPQNGVRRVLLSVCAAFALAGGAARAEPTITTTLSITHTYTTEITGRMQGGPLLFDQLFSLPFADLSVQTAVLQADAVLAGAGAISFTGPALISQQTPFYVVTTAFVGPQTIQKQKDYAGAARALSLAVESVRSGSAVPPWRLGELERELGEVSGARTQR
jgi:hypothetical protein